jgi:hypothetical protein
MPEVVEDVDEVPGITEVKHFINGGYVDETIIGMIIMNVFLIYLQNSMITL